MWPVLSVENSPKVFLQRPTRSPTQSQSQQLETKLPNPYFPLCVVLFGVFYFSLGILNLDVNSGWYKSTKFSLSFLFQGNVTEGNDHLHGVGDMMWKAMFSGWACMRNFQEYEIIIFSLVLSSCIIWLHFPMLRICLWYPFLLHSHHGKGA